jgi:hypothetical protein
LRAYALGSYNLRLETRMAGPSIGNMHAKTRIDSQVAKWYAAVNLLRFLEIAGGEATKRILVVGGGADEVTDFIRLPPGWSVDSCDPITNPAAVLSQEAPTYRCRLQDLGKEFPGVKYDVLVFNHSLYYFAPLELVRVMSELGAKLALATHHDFSDATNRTRLMHDGEVQYWRAPGSADRVLCRVGGNSFNYEHSDMAWVSRGTQIRVGESGMTWSRLRTCGVVQVTGFVSTSGNQVVQDTSEPPPLDDQCVVGVEETTRMGVGRALDSTGIATLARFLRSKVSKVKGVNFPSLVSKVVERVVDSNRAVTESISRFSASSWRSAVEFASFGEAPTFLDAFFQTLKAMVKRGLSSFGAIADSWLSVAKSLFKLMVPKPMNWVVEILDAGHGLTERLAGVASETVLSVWWPGCLVNSVMELVVCNPLGALLQLLPIVVPWWAFAVLHVLWDVSAGPLISPIVEADVCVADDSSAVVTALDSSAHLRVPQDLLCPCSPGVGCVHVGWITSVSCVVCRGCVHNLIRGLETRVLFEKAEVDEEYWRGLMKDISWMPEIHVLPDEDAYMAHLSPQKRKQHTVGLPLTQFGEAVVAFTKSEKLAKASLTPEGTVTLTMKPRIISQRSDEYRSTFAAWCWAAGGVMKRWGRMTHVTYSAGMTGVDVGKWMDEQMLGIDDPVAVLNDFSSFDGTQSPSALGAQYRVLREKFGFPADLPLERDLETFGRWRRDPRVIYEVVGTRKSGNSDTSIGNSIINSLVIMYALRTVGVDWQTGQYAVLVLGDDSVVLVPRECSARFAGELEEASVRAGFKPKVFVREIQEADFCSSNFMPINVDEHVLVWKLGLMFCKAASWCRPPVGWSFQLGDWMRALTHCLIAGYARVPIARAVCLRLSQIFIDEHFISYEQLVGDFDLSESIEMLDGHNNRWATTLAHDERSYDYGIMLRWFEDHYALSPQSVHLVEQRILGLPPEFPWDFRGWPEIDLILRRDVDDADDMLG